MAESVAARHQDTKARRLELSSASVLTKAGALETLASRNNCQSNLFGTCACVLIKHLLWVYRKTKSLAVKKLEESKAKPTS